MPLTLTQSHVLEAAICSYNFPTEGCNFEVNPNAPIEFPNMIALERYIRDLLISHNHDEVKFGLANVIYWGYARAGYRMHRVNLFLHGVTPAQITDFMRLIANPPVTLAGIHGIEMPQFSGMSFISKILMFLNPATNCVLDRQIARLSHPGHVPSKDLDGIIIVGGGIPINPINNACYSGWCNECIRISNKYYSGRYRCVDVERGFFQLITTGNLTLAQDIYHNA